jgi:uncharacterized membrane protein YphA (DoxX/SURF4 family)
MGAPRGFFDDEPVLSSVKVPSDPAQVVVNNASFRVQLAGPAPVSSTLLAPARRAAGFHGAGVPGAAGGGRRRAPVVWSGRTGLEDTGAHRLLQAAVRMGTTVAPERLEPESAAATTQVLPRIDETAVVPTVVGPRGPQPPETAAPPLFPGVRPAGGAFDEPPPEETTALRPFDDEPVRRRGDAVRHAYYPGRRMNLGVVLLPLRIFLGFISIYAGMGKLSDPVYFDGGDRGSMVTWLHSLHPWTIAEPLRDFALAHPVGAGLTVAFLQIIIGVLTVCGLWQRLAASVGALLSAALLVTVSWRSVPVYDAPDIIYLAAWSPLIIAGAPVYSADGRLANEAWRTLGPRVGIWDLRRRVLRRGTVVATVAVGLSLLLGALLGGAVRSSRTVVVPGETDAPHNSLPGSPLPRETGRHSGGRAGHGAAQSPQAGRGPSPSSSARGTTGTQQGGAATQRPQQSTQPVQPTRRQNTPQPPSASAGSTTSGGSSGGGSTGGSTSSGGATGGSSAGGSTSAGSTGGGSTGGGTSGHTGALGGLLG